jgi:hypothetical protein
MSDDKKAMDREDMFAMIDLMSPTEEEIDAMMDADARDHQWDDYYAPKKMTILVPVEVEYHDATDVVYGFKQPSLDDVERALRERNSR